MPLLEAVSLQKAFGGRKVLDSVSLSFPRGSCTALLGRSGSGKTTLARILTGLDKADAGEVLSQDMFRPMLVPQDFSVWPALSIRKNVALGYRGPKANRDAEISSWIEKLGLSFIASQPAGRASYGEQQRTAIARALCFQADFLVLDEPFSNLDAALKFDAASSIRSLCQSLNITLLWITHDSGEAGQVGDFLAILDAGRVSRYGEPQAVYADPQSSTAARLTGPINILTDPEWNELNQFAKWPEVPLRGTASRLGVRPEWLRAQSASQPTGVAPVNYRLVAPGYMLTVAMPSGKKLDVFHDAEPQLGTQLRLELTHPPCVLGSE